MSTGPVELVTFRLANYETPLWAVANFAAGRFNHADAGHTQYLSLHPMTPWAELLRNEDRRTRERALLMRYPLWAIRARLAEAPFALTFDTAGDVGIRPGDLVSDDHAACRRLADRFRADGVTAFTAPSAALPGTTNLVVLEPRVITSWSLEPLDEVDWPGALAAQDGRCPEGLWELVRFRGDRRPHPALQAWRRGESYVFREPPVSVASLAA
ncbi:MAG TPA: RES family NAD+ phosphorylase [Capillimicrobium sp.]|nr:RES family NAD+ phosphorylase [Capillimicrobium sp.]